MQHGEECTGLDELTRAPERILIDCFTALDGGATSDDCFARYPQQAASLRGVLDMRAQLLTLRTTAPSPTTFASGREALLARVVRPLASSHPGSMETQGRQTRGLFWRPATRAAFAGALLFAMTSCAIGVSATPAGDKVGDVLPSIPTIDVPDQRPPYPFPEYNGASPDLLPAEEPAAPVVNESPARDPVEPDPVVEPQIAPTPEPVGSNETDKPADTKPEADPATKPSNPGDTWLPPINAEEDAPPEIETPEPVGQQDDDDADDDSDEEDADESEGDSSDEDKQSGDDQQGDGSEAQQEETAAN